jgi:branched-chain amino acid transport system permease protein
MEKLIETLFNGLSMGAIYALIALGFVLIYKATDILNFANGELVMFGAFLCYTFATLLNLPYVLSFLIAIALGAIFGAIVYTLFFRKITGEPHFVTIMMSIGLMSVLSSVAGLIWGHDVYAIHSPFTEKTFALGSIVLSQGAAYTIGVSVVLFTLFILFFNRSSLGIAMRGLAEDADAAGLMGINVKKIVTVVFAIGTVVAAVGGIFLAEHSFVHVPMSLAGFKGFSAAIIGGMQSIPGAIAGGVIVGIAEGLAASYLSGMEMSGFNFGDTSEVVAHIIMLVVLIIRPRGIFGKAEVERV